MVPNNHIFFIMNPISGTISLFGTYARVLLDSGATHSFISMSFGEKLGKGPSQLPYAISISTPTSEPVRVSTCYLGSELQLSDRSMLVNLTPLPMTDFDIILRMDFLSEYRAIIDCVKKEVTF